MQIETGQKLAFFYGTQVPVEFTAETALPAGVYTFAVKQHRDPAEAAIALSTVTLAEASTTLSTILNFGTETALAVSQTGDFETWLEISTAGKVIYQSEAELLPRVYDGSTPAPTPVTLYYTKEEVDALLAALAVGVTSVNGKTGEVVLDAGDVGAVATPVREALTSTTFAPAPLSIYTHAVAEGDVLDFGTPTGGVPVGFELDLTIPEGVPTFSFAQTITWDGGSAPDFSAPGVYPLGFKYNGTWHGGLPPDMSEYLPLSGGTVTGVLAVENSVSFGKPTNSISLCGGTAGVGNLAFLGRARNTACVAIGLGTVADQHHSTALGYNTTAVGRGHFAVGEYNVTSVDDTVSFTVGIGTGPNARADGFKVFKDGTSWHKDAVTVGEAASTTADVKVITAGGTVSLIDLAARVAALEQ